jgi:NAD(P)-dependent dehydrogenase (short-subunit alcohol dehydrogenase family)
MSRLPFAGRIAVVTGGASGIGQACCELLAQRGAKLVVLDLQAEQASELASAIGGHAYALDVADVAQVEAVAKRAGADMSKVFLTVHKYGNMSAATVAVALVEAGRGRRGSHPGVLHSRPGT